MVTIRGSSARLGLILTLMLALAAAASLPLRDALAARSGRSASANFAVLAAASLSLRQSGAAGAQGVMAELLGDAGMRPFKALAADLFAGLDTRELWSYFFSSGLIMLGAGGADTPVSGLYSPLADVILLVSWRPEATPPAVVDAELLPGAWLRERGEGTIPATPEWYAGKGTAGDRLLRQTGETVRAFEGQFPPKGMAGGLRSLTGPAESAMADAARTRAGLAILGGLLSVRTAAIPSPERPRALAVAHGKSQALLELAAEGKFDTILARAPLTGRGTAAALRRIPPPVYKGMTPVGVIASSEGGVVVMAHPLHPEFCLVLTIAGQGKSYNPVRLELVFFPQPTPGKGGGAF